ncbi:hypothetical protein [Streptomyces sp. 142MFCol3.1]|uniref:hypothetical protein n=1 Tax=Streptomyces sp. 142MFCol3.1 TaxID=1172179 RepID=UPI00131A183A|nr:hypothetical protein [Streptomyces sp. 142MFCol3.1]
MNVRSGQAVATGLAGRRRRETAIRWTGVNAKLSDTLFAALEVELATDAVAHGWPGQTRTPARIKTLSPRSARSSGTRQP